MRFMKEFNVYVSKDVRVYINQCHNKGKKTNLYAVRRDDKIGCARYLGTIKWSGKWRQYIFEPDKDTMWNWNCLHYISSFILTKTVEHRRKVRDSHNKRGKK